MKIHNRTQNHDTLGSHRHSKTLNVPPTHIICISEVHNGRLRPVIKLNLRCGSILNSLFFVRGVD